MRKKKRRTKRKGPSLAVVPRIKGACPKSMIVHMKYNKQAIVNTTSLAYGYTLGWIWASNSIFDPDATGTGHQPRFHDQWQAIYRKYMVRKCTITFRIHNTANSNAAGGYMLIENRSSSEPSKIASAASTEGLLEVIGSSPDIKMRRFTSPAGGSTKWISISKTVVPAFDRKGTDPHQQTALFGANPATRTFLETLAVFPQATGVAAFYVEWSLDYEVILMDPKMPTIS